MEQAADRILAEWQADTRQQLCEGFAALLENVGATLVDFAAKTESLQLQTNFFDAQQILERESADLLKNFCAQLELVGSHPSEAKPLVGGETLSLLERDAYERSVALGTIAGNCVQRNHQNFHAFAQRLSALSGGRRYEIDDLPLNPREITACLEKIIGGLDISSKVRLVLFTLFDRYVMRRLDTALSRINEQLAKAGVLPTIRYEIKKPPGSSAPLGGIPEAAAEPASAQEPGVTQAPGQNPGHPPAGARQASSPQEQAPTAEETMDAITRLVAARREQQTLSQAPGRVQNRVPTLPPEESRREALAALSSEPIAREAAESPALGVLNDQGNKIVIDRELLFRVRSTLKKQRALINSLLGNNKVLNDREQNAIEVVGMLFEAMLDDQTLPDQLKALLSHLHTPYLKIAIRDPRSLSDTDHPARDLLGRMLQLGMRWVDPERLRTGLYPTLQHCVREIIDSPETVDFSALAKDVETKAAQLAQAQKVSEKRTLDAEKGRTMLSRARETAESATRALLESHALPAPVRIFFQTVFTDYMSLLLLRNELNPNDPKCREALNAAVRLIESVDRSDIPIAQQAGESLKQLIEVLLPHYQNKIDMFLEHLEHTITSAEREQPPAPKVEHTAQASTAKESDEELIAKAMEVAPGSWFMLQESPEEQALMVKLLWSNPHTHHLLFVDQHGLKRAHLSAQEFVQHLNSGSLEPIEIQSDGVLGRLFSAIKRRLESSLSKETES